MVHVLALLILAVIATPFARAHATAPAPVCRLPAVIDVMARELRSNPYYTRIGPELIGESPTADPKVVRCDVCLNIILYDTGRFGDVPVARCEARIFTVRAVSNGFVVHPQR